MRQLFFLLAILIGISACKPESNNPQGKLEIVFKAKYNEAPLVFFQDIPTGKSDPDTIMFKKLFFFISNIKGVTGGSTKDFIDLGYISLTNTLSQATAEAGVVFAIDNIPAGNYTQLNLGIGLSDAVNSTEPGDYPSSSPLNGNYWYSWSSYKYSTIEGDIIQANNSRTGFLYHAGANGMRQLREFVKNFTISEGQTTQLVFHINAEDFFFKAGKEINLITENVSHTGAVGSVPYYLALKYFENLADALELQP